MKKRCFDNNDKRYKDYGGRGITVSAEWMKFENFYRDMGDAPEGLSLDRIDNNKGYSKDNCKWSTAKEQQRNVRSNFVVEYNNTIKPVIVWAEEIGMKPVTLITRIKRGWSLDRAFTQPIQIKGGSNGRGLL